MVRSWVSRIALHRRQFSVFEGAHATRPHLTLTIEEATVEEGRHLVDLLDSCQCQTWFLLNYSYLTDFNNSL